MAVPIRCNLIADAPSTVFATHQGDRLPFLQFNCLLLGNERRDDKPARRFPKRVTIPIRGRGFHALHEGKAVPSQ